VSNDEMEQRITSVYRQFDASRKLKDAKEADVLDLEELKSLENKINSSKA
jgi:hypothetical protein